MFFTTCPAKRQFTLNIIEFVIQWNLAHYTSLCNASDFSLKPRLYYLFLRKLLNGFIMRLKRLMSSVIIWAIPSSMAWWPRLIA